MNYALEVYEYEKLIFSSNGKWLHPLFELEDYLNQNSVEPKRLFLKDKIAGKAAAFLMVRLGFKKVAIDLISDGAIKVFKHFDIDFEYSNKVPAIECKTETIIDSSQSPQEVWQMLRRRAGRVSGMEILVSQLSVKFEEQTVLNNLDLHVGKGEQIFIKGANGTGKTTLLKTILGVIKPNSGNVKIGDFEMNSQTWKSINTLIGYVNQAETSTKFPISAAEVVAIGLACKKYKKKEIDHRVEIAMKRTNCYQLSKKSYFDLSGGEKQRIALARCICQEARVLLLDEPTSFLDTQSKKELHDLLKQIWQNEAPTAIIVSHDDEWINQFNWPVYELKDGIIC